METKLKLYRDKRRLTQSAVARLADISERAYNVHEKGKGGACRSQIRDRIAEVLGVAPSALFTKEGHAR